MTSTGAPEYFPSIQIIRPKVWTLEKEKKYVTQSVFELQKYLSTHIHVKFKFLNILDNKHFDNRPLISIFVSSDSW